ncbi:PD40 domain-containing protein [candidate division KSB1 bacterium]|nr:PD40 domain-containing protein [candidate division KSB1 bacterium]
MKMTPIFKRCFLRITGVTMLLLMISSRSWGQNFPIYTHPELDWFTISTKHFEIHYHEGAERTAQVAAKIGEEIYYPVTSLYLYEPDTKIHIIIRDHDDYSNGGAFYYDNKIEIWANPMDFILRGTHNWMRNVMTHEFSHMISLGAARKMTRLVPAFYFQYMDYEPEKNPYVLRGFPNRIASYPLAMTVVPMWFAEGVAQFQLPGLDYDVWDTHRDMILRDAVIEHNVLDYNEMSVFGDNSIRNEKVYNHGYSMTKYIADTYGVESLRKIMHAMQAPWRFSIDGALKSVLNVSEKQLHEDWQNYIEKMYADRLSVIQKHVVTGVIDQNKGKANLFPIWNPTGSGYAFLSNRGEDYLSRTTLYLAIPGIQEPKKIKVGVNSSICWSPDGKKIAYARHSAPDKHFSHYQDVYIYDLVKKQETPLTKNLRAQSPDWSPTGEDMLFVVTKDGTQNIATVNLKTQKVMHLTKFKNGEQIFSPRYSPNGQVIVFSVSRKDDRDLGLISADGKKLKFILTDEYDARDPVFSADGKSIYFSYDKTGIFNIYRMTIDGSKVELLTNVVGGAFMPAVNKDGKLLFTCYQHEGFAIAQLDNPVPIDPANAEYVPYQKNFHVASVDADAIVAIEDGNGHNAQSNYDDMQLPEVKPTPYKYQYSKMQFFPRVMRDYGTTKVGTYFTSSELLNNYDIIGGVAANSDYDLDLFGIVNYRRWKQPLFLEIYSQILHHGENGLLEFEVSPGDTFRQADTPFNYKYNLLEADMGIEGSFLNDFNHLRLAFIFSRYNATVKYPLQQYEQKYSYTYLIGRALQLKWKITNFNDDIWADSEINPRNQRKITITANQEYNAFIDSFKVSSYGTLVEEYKNYNFTKVELNWREYIGLMYKTTLDLELQAGAIVQPVHEFFNFFAGGMLGNRGYPYYSIEGRKLLQGRATYRVPVWDINHKLLFWYMDDLYAGLFYDYGDAFNEDKIDLNNFKGSYGFEFRLSVTSFYGFPTRIFFNAAHGRHKFIKQEEDTKLLYGDEWRYYVGVTFGYF